MVAEIKAILVVPSFGIVNGEIRPILTVIGGQDEVAEIREWFDKARGQGKIPSFLATQEVNLPRSTPEKVLPPDMRMRRRCKDKDCLNLVSVDEGEYCELHVQGGSDEGL